MNSAAGVRSSAPDRAPNDAPVNAEFLGPRTGADRAVLLAHGAGTGLDAPPLVVVAEHLAAAGVPSLRFDFPYRAAGRKAPDRAPVLVAAVRAAAAALTRRTGVPAARMVVGGRSMGGRMCSMAVSDEEDPLPALGLALLGYPLYPAGRPERIRDEHFPRIRVPSLFVSGTRDALAARDDLTLAVEKIRGRVTLHWLDDADHSFRVRKASGRTNADVLVEVAATTTKWVLARR